MCRGSLLEQVVRGRLFEHSVSNIIVENYVRGSGFEHVFSKHGSGHTKTTEFVRENNSETTNRETKYKCFWKQVGNLSPGKCVRTWVDRGMFVECQWTMFNGVGSMLCCGTQFRTTKSMCLFWNVVFEVVCSESCVRFVCVWNVLFGARVWVFVSTCVVREPTCFESTCFNLCVRSWCSNVFVSDEMFDKLCFDTQCSPNCFRQNLLDHNNSKQCVRKCVSNVVRKHVRALCFENCFRTTLFDHLFRFCLTTQTQNLLRGS